jgi:transposase
MMDTYTQPVTTKRQYRSLEEKQRIVGEALAEGASVARVARAHGVNANLVFNWCRLYRAGRLGRRSEAKLLPVRVADESSTPPPAARSEPGGLLAVSAGTIHIQLQHAQVQVESGANPVLLRVLLECLQQ